jgi:hypothetical protein
MQRLLLIVLCCVLFAKFSFAQEQLTGRVYENKTKVFLQGVRVEDMKSHVMTITGPDGSFSIKAAAGDLVRFSNSNYKPDTVYLADLKYIQVFLDPVVNQLQEVQVKNQQIKGNAGFSIQPEKGVLGSKTVLYQTDDNGNYKGGIKLNIPDGRDTKRIHEERISEDERQKDGIRKVFNADSLKKYLPFSGQEMENFIIMYMPDVKTFYSGYFNLVVYLTDSYKDFMKIPLQDRRSKSLTQLTGKE